MKILAASGDRDLLAALLTLLKLEGYEAVPAFDGIIVSAELSEGSFDALLIDDKLPRVNSDKLLSLPEVSELPAVLMTGSERPTGSGKGRSEPDEVVHFPFEPEELLAALRRAAGRKQRQ